jgi:hypothetical protein
MDVNPGTDSVGCAYLIELIGPRQREHEEGEHNEERATPHQRVAGIHDIRPRFAGGKITYKYPRS